MASKKSRRSARNTPTGKNVVGIQKKINQDYEILFRDYKKLVKEMFERPVVRYAFGGLAFAALIPVAVRFLRRYPEVTTLVSENVPLLRGRSNAEDLEQATINH